MNGILLELFTVSVCLLFGATICALISPDVRNKIGFKVKTLKISAIVLFCLTLVALWFETPTRMGDHIYIERDLVKHKQTIHTSSSCPRIKNGYEVSDTKHFKSQYFLNEYCPRCMYQSDVIKLSEQK